MSNPSKYKAHMSEEQRDRLQVGWADRDPDRAIACYQQAVALNPNDVDAHHHLGNALKAKGHLAEAKIHYQQAITLKPDFSEAYNNLGFVLQKERNLEEASAYYEKALNFNPNYAQAYNNLGNVRKEQGKIAEAIAFYNQALALQPDFAEAHKNLGMALLLTGDFKNGWAEYLWYWQTHEYSQRSSMLFLWDGSDLQEKKILLLCEKGFGDCIQFIRYAPLVAQRGGRVIVGCYPELLRLFSTVSGIEQLVTKGTVVEYDVGSSLMRLPYLFGTNLETLPTQIPYIATPQPDLFSFETAPNTYLKVGIVWAGSPTNKNDCKRSCGLEHFLPLLHIPKIAFYSLQKGARATDLAKLDSRRIVQDLSNKLSDFADTATAIAQLDLVITMDTSVAHLAGAMGKPVWIVLSFVANWRWLMEREDSPWYPTMSLFRQSQPGDWAGVFERVAVALENWVADLQHKEGNH